MMQNALKSGWGRILIALVGTLIYAVGINLFVVPLEIFTGGVMGLCQLLRTLILMMFHMEGGGFDFAGLIYYALNIPLLVLAYKSLGPIFFRNTLLCTTASTVFLSLIPIPSTPIVNDTLTSCLLGGVISGVGIGITLTSGCCCGGLDIISLFLAKKGKRVTVGQFALVFNAVLFLACGLLFDLSTLIYSLLNTIFHSMALDRSHRQSVNVQMLIFTKEENTTLKNYITETLHRGVTMWEGQGLYTGETTHVLCVCMNKYEVDDFRAVLRREDPSAFFIVQEGVHISGNFDRRLS